MNPALKLDGVIAEAVKLHGRRPDADSRALHPLAARVSCQVNRPLKTTVLVGVLMLARRVSMANPDPAQEIVQAGERHLQARRVITVFVVIMAALDIPKGVEPAVIMRRAGIGTERGRWIWVAHVGRAYGKDHKGNRYNQGVK